MPPRGKAKAVPRPLRGVETRSRVTAGATAGRETRSRAAVKETARRQAAGAGQQEVVGPARGSKRKADDPNISIETKASKKKKAIISTPERRSVSEVPVRVAQIHVGNGGEEDLALHLAGRGGLALQVEAEEPLPDIACRELVGRLDREGTARDYVDPKHRCSPGCPVGCLGHLRPNEVVIVSGWRYAEAGQVVGRTRMRGRLVAAPSAEEAAAADTVVGRIRLQGVERVQRTGRARHQETDRRRRQQLGARRRAGEAPPVDTALPSPPKALGGPTPQRVGV
jgi:hypothetical protein